MITEMKTEYEVYKVVEGKYTTVFSSENEQEAKQALEQNNDCRLLILHTYKQIQNETTKES
jgi:hypothetical protein